MYICILKLHYALDAPLWPFDYKTEGLAEFEAICQIWDIHLLAYTIIIPVTNTIGKLNALL